MDAGLLKTLGEVLGIGGGRARGLLPPVPRSYSEIDFPDAEEGRCIPAPAIDLHIGLVGGGDWCRSLVLGRSKGANKFNHDDRTTKPGCSGNEGRCADRLQYTPAESQMKRSLQIIAMAWLVRAERQRRSPSGTGRGAALSRCRSPTALRGKVVQ